MLNKIIFRDPVFDGAADPTVIRRESDGRYFMFYTQRRATLECSGVEWAHGTKIGVAVCDEAFGEGKGKKSTPQSPAATAAPPRLRCPKPARMINHPRLFRPRHFLALLSPTPGGSRARHLAQGSPGD